MGVTSQSTFGTPFRGNNSALPLCGMATNLEFAMTKMRQAKLPAATTAKTIYAGQPVAIDNRVGAANTTDGTGFNSSSLEITGLAATPALTAGFVLCGDMDQTDVDGGSAYAQRGLFCNIGLIGSGIETWLPCEAGYANAALTTASYWDATNLCLSATPATVGDAAFTIKLLSSVVDGYKLKKNASTSLVEWIATKCIKVQL